MDIERRLTNLENLVASLIKKINNDKFYDEADKSGIRSTNASNDEARKTETSDNSDAIFELADMVAELEAKND